MKLNTVILLSFLFTVGSIVAKGLHPQIIVFIVIFVMFALRKYGYYAKVNKLVTVDIVLAVIFLIFELMMKKVSWPRTGIYALFQALNIAIMEYDDKNFIYREQEEIRKD